VLLFTLRAAPDLRDPMLASADGGLPHVVKSVLGAGLGRIFLCDVAFAIFVCTLSLHTCTVRVMFAMARDGKLPFSSAFAKVSRATRTPVIPAIAVGAGAILILVVNIKFPKIVELTTAIPILWANLAYLLVVAAMLWQRFSGKMEGSAGSVLAGAAGGADQCARDVVVSVYGGERELAAVGSLRRRQSICGRRVYSGAGLRRAAFGSGYGRERDRSTHARRRTCKNFLHPHLLRRRRADKSCSVWKSARPSL
jgi:hypothetical protein